MLSTSQTNTVLSHQIREQNLQSVREVLHREQICTVSELKARTGLSVVTINKLVSELVRRGEVLRGKPPTVQAAVLQLLIALMLIFL